MSINQINLSGNLGADAQQKVSKTKGSSYVEFSLANKDSEDTVWYRCLVFGKSAEKALMILKKGDHVFVSGKLKAEAYASVPNGVPKVGLTVMVTTWERLNNKRGGDTFQPKANSVPSLEANQVEFDLPF